MEGVFERMQMPPWQRLHYGRPPNWKIGHSQSQRSAGPALDWTADKYIQTHSLDAIMDQYKYKMQIQIQNTNTNEIHPVK